ncbi:hypothetical protein WMY93_013758 [Mugilogobius chulae]|uniref:Uncharacterized protein n=1 Tax=Mugilogobius chulae TaxID=88201 RepID=A0AAW0PA60_9GOBI
MVISVPSANWVHFSFGATLFRIDLLHLPTRSQTISQSSTFPFSERVNAPTSSLISLKYVTMVSSGARFRRYSEALSVRAVSFAALQSRVLSLLRDEAVIDEMMNITNDRVKRV